MMDAHLHNVIEPGTYSDRVKDTLKANNMPIINFPPIKSSAPLLKYVQGLETRVKKARQSERQESEPESEHDTSQEEILERHMDIESLPIRNIKEYDTEIYANKDTFKNTDLSPEYLAIQYKTGNIKVINKEHSKYTPDNIHHLIENMRVYCNKEDINIITPSEYRKIRSTSQRTPDKNVHKKTKYNQ